ncbi:MAG: NAD(P)H-binding protein [Anaerolineae bacterium]|nr:NAD(P)H-binding protein [Anaerolineae bacterium]
MNQKILVPDATGRVNSEVVKQLAAKGAYVVAGVRDLDAARSMGWRGVELTLLDYDHPATFNNALVDVDRLFLALPLDDPDAYESVIPLLEYARQVGVRHVVLLSAVGVERIRISPLRRVEQFLQNSRMIYTILRSGWFFQHFVDDEFIGQDVRQGFLRFSTGEAKVSFIDLRDAAAVGVIALTEDGHANKMYNVSAQVMDIVQIAEMLSKVLGRPIRYEQITDQEAMRVMRARGISREVAKWWGLTFQLMRQGAYSDAQLDISVVLGRPVITFKQFVQENIHAWD